jgi:hypothetical protein
MARTRGFWLGAAVSACLALAGCAEGALVTPPSTATTGQSSRAAASGGPSGSTGSTDGVPGSGALSPSPSPTESAGAGVVDESAGRYDDGLPKVVDGQQVLRDGDAIAHTKEATGTEPFLLGGWLTPGQGAQAGGPATPAPCGTDSCPPPATIHLADKAGTVDNPLDKAVDFHPLAGATLATGPVVLQVHAHDPTAACSQPTCDETMVVDAVIWSGDAATAPAPYSVDDVTAAITAQIPDTSFLAIGSPVVDCGHQLPAATLLVATPPEDESGITAPRDWISSVSVAPSVDALNAALDSVAKAKTPSARPGTANVLSKANLVCREQPGGPFRTFRYLVLDNIAVIVATSSDPSLQDRVFIEGLANALKTQIASASPSPEPTASSESTAPPSPSASSVPRRTPKPSKKP